MRASHLVFPLLTVTLLATPALAQSNGSSLMQDTGALMGGASGSGLASKLPIPAVSDDSALSYLKAARSALAGGKTGLAQEALERAESRLLTRDVAPSQAGAPSTDPSISEISKALQALASGQTSTALQVVDALIAKM
ncbi:MAG: hypothetical protein LGL72_06385 [Acidibrevibacterium sp.]|jgi:hypothetical protein|uniref:hypothetical protein n=1 Tax=Acidibrevibacterium fodinaquatile TaxID=1969806 RepID=UPI000E0DA5F9|nr:hypothetical protein [Acidibrevibacterium fodinaquatile]MCA7119024.1 hypothetical protein [Acidibrevibacterium fodinaquatile]